MASSLARAVLHVFADHRAVGLKEREVRLRADSARMRRAKAIIYHGHDEGQAIWRLTPRDLPLCLNP